MMAYNPHDWYWIVAGDDSKAWSSVSGNYVADWPADRTTRIASEQELSDVLSPYNLPGPVTTWDAVRDKRGHLISDCDWTQLPDSPLSATETAAWATYRQSLRDITNVFATPNEVIWPQPPE